MFNVESEEDFFLYTFTDYSSLSPTEIESELQAELERERKTRSVYLAIRDGSITKGDWDEFLDMQAESGVNPYDWIDCVKDNLYYTMKNNLPVESVYGITERERIEIGIPKDSI